MSFSITAVVRHDAMEWQVEGLGSVMEHYGPGNRTGNIPYGAGESMSSGLLLTQSTVCDNDRGDLNQDCARRGRPPEQLVQP